MVDWLIGLFGRLFGWGGRCGYRLHVGWVRLGRRSGKPELVSIKRTDWCLENELTGIFEFEEAERRSYGWQTEREEWSGVEWKVWRLMVD